MTTTNVMDPLSGVTATAGSKTNWPAAEVVLYRAVCCDRDWNKWYRMNIQNADDRVGGQLHVEVEIGVFKSLSPREPSGMRLTMDQHLRRE